MKSSLRPRTTSRLSDSVQHQLNMYALAASAAGVSVLALAHPAEARIIYTPTHHVIEGREGYSLAMNHKTADFRIYEVMSGGTDRPWVQLAIESATNSGKPTGNEVVSGTSSHNRWLWALALKPGSIISKDRRLKGFGAMAIESRRATTCDMSRRTPQRIAPSTTCWNSYTNGPWVNVTDRYLGLKFKIDGKFHYGWARLSVQVPAHEMEIVATLTGYAYETIPNKAIIAGKEHGTDDETEEPATLGRLALGRK